MGKLLKNISLHFV